MARWYDPFRPDPRLRMAGVVPLGRDAATTPTTILAYVDRYVPMVNAGAEWMLHAMLADSAARGHRVIVATPCTDRARLVDGVEVHPVREGLRAGEDAEVLVGHLLFTKEVIDLARMTGRPLLYLVHNSDQLRAWRISRDDVSALVWNSEWIAAEGRPMPEARRIPGTIVRPPLDPDRYRTPDWSPRTHVTLVNPIQAKGSTVFYEMAARFPRMRFLAVEGAYGSQQRPMVQQRNVEWQPATSDIAGDVYARTRVLLMPSTYESWGRVACEALCSGIPVIAAPTPGLRESLAGGATFVDPHDLDGWASALAALDDLGTYAEAAARALARADELAAVATADLERWDRLVTLAAGASRVRSGSMETTPADKYDPFRGSKAKARPPVDPTTAAADLLDAGETPPVDHLGVLDTWVDSIGGAVRSVEIQRVWLPMADAAPEAEWEGLAGVSAGDDLDHLGIEDIMDLLTDPDIEADASAADASEVTARTFRGYLVAADGQSLVLVSPTLPIIELVGVDEDATSEATAPPAGLDATPTPEDAPEAQEATQAPAPWEVPAKAVDIVHTLGTVADPEVARARAAMVRAAELARPEGDRRKSVLAAADKILGT